MVMVFANIAFLIIGLLTAKVSAKFLIISQPTVWAAVSVLCVVGSYCINNRFMDVVIMFVMACLGFFSKVYDFPNGPLVLGLLLGGNVEKNLRTALTISKGDWSYFITRPISLFLIVMIIITFMVPILKTVIKNYKQKKV